MAINQKIVSLATIIYALPNVRKKDEIKAVASILLRSDMNYSLNRIEERVDKDRLTEVAQVKFRTPDRENEYKRIIATVAVVVKGNVELTVADIFDDGTLGIKLDTKQKPVKAGKLKLYTLES